MLAKAADLTRERGAEVLASQRGLPKNSQAQRVHVRRIKDDRFPDVEAFAT